MSVHRALPIAIQCFAGLVLARILGPYAFGLVATAWAIVGVGTSLVDLSLPAREPLDDRAIRSIFTVRVAVGVALASLLSVSAGLFARALGDEGLTAAIRCLSLGLIAQSLGQTSLAMLRHRQDFRGLQRARLAGCIAGYLLIALPLAMSSLDATLSLVWGLVAQLAVTSGVAYEMVRHPWRLLWNPVRWTLSRAKLVRWLLTSLDTLAMSRAFGLGFTGFYNRAQSLSVNPAWDVVPLMSPRLLMLVLLPAAALLAVAAPLIVSVVLGSEWTSTGPMLTPLAASMPMFAAVRWSGDRLRAAQRGNFEFRAQLASLGLLAAMLGWAMQVSPVAIAWGVFAVTAVRAGVLLYAVNPATVVDVVAMPVSVAGEPANRNSRRRKDRKSRNRAASAS